MQVHSEHATIRRPVSGIRASEWRSAVGQRLVIDVVIVLVLALPLTIGILRGDAFVTAVVVAVMMALIFLCHYVASCVRVSGEAIERRAWGRVKRVEWEEVDSYRIVVNDSLIALGGGAFGILGRFAAQRLVRQLSPKQLRPDRVIVEARSGTNLVIPSDLVGYDELLDQLLLELTNRIYTRARKSLDAGGAVAFGELLEIGPDGSVNVRLGREKTGVLSDDDVGSASVERAELVIRRKRDNSVWQRLPLSKLKNHGVFVRFIAEGNAH